MKNKYQEALDIISSRCVETSDNDEKQMDLLQELVDKATPKKLSETKIQYTIEIPAYMVVKTCPKCNRKFDYKNMGVNYCSICGQRLDWEE